ncbi:MAG: hypothetical protein NZL83_00175 [Candidatus Absconditabacterales bacterium]|nr:hypothetical protein [Candidatus Absconditabacterales bacterium]
MGFVPKFLTPSGSIGGPGSIIKSLCVGLLLGLFVHAHDIREPFSSQNQNPTDGLLPQPKGHTTQSCAESLLARMIQGAVTQRELFTCFMITPQKDVWNTEDLIRRQLFDTLARKYPHIDFFYGPMGGVTRRDPCHEPGKLGTISLTTEKIILCEHNIKNILPLYVSAYTQTAHTKQAGSIYDSVYAELLDLVRLNEALHIRMMDMRKKHLRPYPGSNTEDIYLAAVKWYLEKLCGIKKLYFTSLHDYEEALSDVATLAGGKNQGLTARFLYHLGHHSVYSAQKHHVRSKIFAYLGYDPQQTYSLQQRLMIQRKAETFLSNFFNFISVQDYHALYRMYYVYPNTKYRFVRP